MCPNASDGAADEDTALRSASEADDDPNSADSGVFDLDNPDNPVRDWTMVFMPYCTGDVHAGTRTNATAETWGLWFDGHLNFARILDDLKAKHGLGDAQHAQAVTLRPIACKPQSGQ